MSPHTPISANPGFELIFFDPKVRQLERLLDEEERGPWH